MLRLLSFQRTKSIILPKQSNIIWKASQSRLQSSFSNNNDKPFEKVLVANRGEIACRVIRTAKRLGIQTVALFSEADGPQSLHASMADEAYLIGDGPSPVDSYLRGDEVLDIALQSGAQAIHPGYGFLSENSNFATKASQKDITFIGPPPSAILAMGSKSHSKSIMVNAGVPTTPGYHGKNQDPDYLHHEAITNVGFPLLIKATMGGGGKGMRLVWNENDFLSALESCKRESQAAFGDTNVILEKYLVHPRHIEIQVMADTHGNTVYLHERDCSLQRRHQKIIEEAPASDLPLSTRVHMGQMAVKAAEAVGYVNAGTIEFLVDTQSANDEMNNFYFCEMNTRLQVEHPVTEMITKQDLVEWQLRIASGEELPIKDQSKIPCVGHSMEARIYAENPTNDFLPATGNVWFHNPPVLSNMGGDDIRVDTGIQTDDDITVYYDPMVSKLIVHGDTRDDALQGLISSLKNYQIAGVPSNIPFLINCAEHPTFAKAGAINTGFLEEYADDVKLNVEDVVLGTPLEQAVCAFAVSMMIEGRITTGSTESASSAVANSPWSNKSGSWRIGGLEGRHERELVPLYTNGDEAEDDSTIKCISNHDGSFDMLTRTENGTETIHIDGTINSSTNRMNVTINNTKKISLTIVSNENIDSGTIAIQAWSNQSGGGLLPSAFGMTFRHPLPIASDALISGSGSGSNANGSGTLSVKAPMPGKITRIQAVEGDSVEENELLLVMEAMKMEHSIYAPLTGIVEELNCSVGDVVNDGHLLAVVKESDLDDDTTMSSTAE